MIATRKESATKKDSTTIKEEVLLCIFPKIKLVHVLNVVIIYLNSNETN